MNDQTPFSTMYTSIANEEVSNANIDNIPNDIFYDLNLVLLFYSISMTTFLHLLHP